MHVTGSSFILRACTLTQVPHDLPELLKRRFEVFHNLLCDDVKIREVVGGIEGFVLEPEDVEAGLNPFWTQRSKVCPIDEEFILHYA